MEKAISWVLGAASLVVLVIFVTGYFENPNFNEEIEWETSYPVQAVWDVLVDLETIPEKKRGVESVEILARYFDLYAWRENLGSDKFRKYRMVDVDDPNYLKIELTESSYGLTGTWEFTLKKNGDSTLIKIREESELASTWRRGLYFYLGRDFELNSWARYIRVGLLESLLKTS